MASARMMMTLSRSRKARYAASLFTQEQVGAELARRELVRRGVIEELPRLSAVAKQALWYKRYGRDLIGFAREILGLEPWRGVNGYQGQYEVLEAVQRSVNSQLDGKKEVPYIFVVEAPHGVGKTYGIEAVLANWFYRCFSPSVTISTAPTDFQLTNLLWKDIRTHNTNAKSRGYKVLEGLLPQKKEARLSENHFTVGITTSDSGGKGTERAQGQHNKYQLVIFDEGEGVPEFMYDGIKRQFTGNSLRLWVVVANPKTDTSTFQEMKKHPLAVSIRLSLLGFPNVWNGSDEVAGGTSRHVFNEWIEDQRTFGCEVVLEHDEALHTFSLPWDVPKSGGGTHPSGTIFAPKRGFLYGALGIPPSGSNGDTLISTGRYEACLERTPVAGRQGVIQIGVDCARYGDDAGTVYSYHAGVLRFEAAIQGGAELDTMTRSRRYVEAVIAAVRAILARGAPAGSLSIRVDAGTGSGPIDMLRESAELARIVAEFNIYEVSFGSKAHDSELYADIVTEMYAEADTVLRGSRIDASCPAQLKYDLTNRRYGYITRAGGEAVKKLEPKDKFKRRSRGKSPDDGDGAVLALAPEHIFAAKLRPASHGAAAYVSPAD